MSSKTTLYRRSNPEYYEEEKKKDAVRMKNKYANDPEYREYMKKYYKERYQRLKAEKLQTQLDNSIEKILQ